jgi:DNA-binding transcriptional MerR regulator
VNYTAKEASEITGLSTAALRYYEKEGIIPSIYRNELGSRKYSKEDITWVQMIQCLRSANVPVKSIKIYVKLLLEGSSTIDQRINLIEEYKQKMVKDMEYIQNGLNLINSKLSFYEKIKKQNCSNLTYLDEWKMFKESE